MTEPGLPDTDPLALEAEIPTAPMTVHLGPSHPAMHGTVRLVVTLDGETIVEAVPEIGFLHRGFSKSSENSTWHQVLPYTDRLNYVSPILNNTGYIMGVEKLIGLKPTERAEYLRVLGGEISRICDHLTCIGAIGLELGAFTTFLYAMEARELLWDRIAELCGARVTVSWTRIGGVASGIPPCWGKQLPHCPPSVVELFNQIGQPVARYPHPPKKEVFGSIEGVMAHFTLIMEGIPVPAGEVYVYTEGANGELGFHIVSNGKGKPYAIQVRGPGLPILSALPRLIKGHAVADLIPIFDSINMIGGEVEQ